jgi:hypothetical protein
MRHRGKADGDTPREKPMETSEKPMGVLRKSHGDTVEERPLRAA